MQLFPNSRIFVSFGSLSITWYAVLILTGAICAYALSQKIIQKWGYSSALLENYLFPMLLCGIFGARIYYVIFEWDYYSLHPELILATWHGGLAIHGGLIAGVLFSVFYFHRHRVSLLRMFDLIMPHVLLAQAFGRWGNFANQEAYGRIVSEHFYDGFPAFIKEQMFIQGAYRMPTFLFESVLDLCGFLLIVFVFRRFFYRKRGDAGSMYLIWYGWTRFLVEGMRTDSLMLGPFRIAQIVSLCFVGLGLLLWSGLFHRIFGWNRKPVLLFDMDGTLVSSRNVIFALWDRLFQEEKPGYILSEEEKEAFFGPDVPTALSWYFPEDQIERLHKRYEELYLELLPKYIKGIVHEKETLEKLHEQKITMGIVSNKTVRLIQADLKALGLDSYISVIVGADTTPAVKPDPAGLIQACDLLKVGHDDLIYVGDTPNDVQACRSMAGYSVAFCGDSKEPKALLKAEPCRVVHDLSELLSLIEQEHLWCDRRIW